MRVHPPHPAQAISSVKPKQHRQIHSPIKTRLSYPYIQLSITFVTERNSTSKVACDKVLFYDSFVTTTLTFFFDIYYFDFRFEAKRVIIRQGHTAENFYFILSGTGKTQENVLKENTFAQDRLCNILITMNSLASR